MEQVKVLIVEDEAIIVEDLRIALAKMQYAVVGVAVTAEDAVQKTEKLNPDLILMDIMLGGDKTGIDAAQEIKKKNNIPVIYITAYSDIELIRKAEATGPVAYIVKPVDKTKLEACIKLTLLIKTQEKNLEEKIKELEEEKNPEKRNALEKEVKTLQGQVEKQKKELMIFLNQ